MSGSSCGSVFRNSQARNPLNSIPNYLGHVQMNLAGKTVYWLPSDTKELWQKNMQDPDKKHYLDEMNWNTENSIQYKFNKQGFRTEEFSRRDCFLALGCSFTVGTGLEQHQTWPEVLAQQIQLPVYNLGVFGCAIDTCFRLCYYYIDVIKPKFVIMMSPPRDRTEIIESMRGQTVTYHGDLCDRHKSWFAYEQNSELNYHKHNLALHQLCANRDIPFYSYDSFCEIKDHARDFMHQGPTTHREFVHSIVEHIHF